MQKSRFFAALGAGAAMAMALPGVAVAGSPEGKWQVKLMGTDVVPNGEIDSVLSGSIAAVVPTLNPAADTRANDNLVPTLAAEYFFTPNVSVETICCLTAHHVIGLGALAAGKNLIDDIVVLPATVTAKLHLPLGPIKPYVGAGPSYFIVLDSKTGPDVAVVPTATASKLKSKFGFALQAGVDVPLGSSGFGLSIDAKRYFMRPVAEFSNAAGEVLSTRHKLDPWLLSAGISYRF